MTPDPLTDLCAILRGDRGELPTGEAGARLLHLARSHRVQFLLAWRLPEPPQALATEVREAALLDELRVRELARVVAVLEDPASLPVVFKGAALAHTHYAESWLRPRLDTDILINPLARTEVFERLRDLGYERPAFISGDLVMHQTPFVRTDEAGLEHVLDVHWHVANPHVVAGVLSHHEIAGRARVIDVHGQAVRVPCPVDALLLACVHRAAHHDDADELLWVYDVHALAERCGPAEWDAFVGLASDRAVRMLCARGLQLSLDRFHTKEAAAPIARLAPHTQVGAEEPSSVYLRRDLRRVDRLASDVRALGPWAGARLVREHLFPGREYMERRYGARRRALLPALYVRRILAGVFTWFSRPQP